MALPEVSHEEMHRVPRPLDLFAARSSQEQTRRSKWQDLVHMSELEMQRSMARFFAREGATAARRTSTQRWAAALCDPNILPTLSAHKLLNVHYKGFEFGCLEHVCKFAPRPPEPENVEDIWASCLADHGMLMLYTFEELRDLVKSQPESSIAIGYCRTSSEAKAGEERSSSLGRQKAGLKAIRGIIPIGFYYCIKGEPSYKGPREPERPASAMAFQTLQDSVALCLAFNRCMEPNKNLTAVGYLAIPEISRFSRRAKLGLEALELLSSMKVKLASSRDTIDYIAGGHELTSSSAFTFTVMLAKAQMERDDIKYRTNVGLARRWAAERQQSAFTNLIASTGGRRSMMHVYCFALVMLPRLAEHGPVNDQNVQGFVDGIVHWLAQPGESQACVMAYVDVPTTPKLWRQCVRRWEHDLTTWLAEQPAYTGSNAATLIREHVEHSKDAMQKAVRIRLSRGPVR